MTAPLTGDSLEWKVAGLAEDVRRLTVDNARMECTLQAVLELAMQHADHARIEFVARGGLKGGWQR